MQVNEVREFVVFDSELNKTVKVDGLLKTWTQLSGPTTYICNCTYKGVLLAKEVNSKSLIDKPFNYPPQ